MLSAGKKLLGGHVGGALKALSGGAEQRGDSRWRQGRVRGRAGRRSAAGSAGGAHAALQLVAGRGRTAPTRPQLRSTWFSATYWRVAAIAALLTLPFLFAAAVQALLRSDLDAAAGAPRSATCRWRCWR